MSLDFLGVEYLTILHILCFLRQSQATYKARLERQSHEHVPPKQAEPGDAALPEALKAHIESLGRDLQEPVEPGLPDISANVEGAAATACDGGLSAMEPIPREESD